MKQLSNTPEAVAYITGLGGPALRNRISSLFRRERRAPGHAYRSVPVPHYAQALLQENHR